jgi:activating signal cointegrator complex subunit 1
MLRQYSICCQKVQFLPAFMNPSCRRPLASMPQREKQKKNDRSVDASELGEIVTPTNMSASESEVTLKHKPPQLTHFLCIPLVNETSYLALEAALERFKAEVCEPVKDENASSDSSAQFQDGLTLRLPPKAIRPLGTLHLTIAVMALETEEKLQKAIEHLKALDLQTIFNNTQRNISNRIKEQHSIAAQPVTVSLTSLKAMRSPANTSILFAEPIPLGAFSIWEFCDSLRKDFTENGFVSPEKRPLKLHATIVNTLYARQRARKGRSKPLHFDATELIKNYAEFTWAENIRLDRLAICKMGAKEVVKSNGTIVVEYEEVASINMPKYIDLA